MKYRRIGQFVGKLANRLKIANSLVHHTEIRELDELGLTVRLTIGYDMTWTLIFDQSVMSRPGSQTADQVRSRIYWLLLCCCKLTMLRRTQASFNSYSFSV